MEPAGAVAVAVVPIIVAIVVSAAELRRRFVELGSEKVELSQDLYSQHWVGSVVPLGGLVGLHGGFFLAAWFN